MKKLILRTFALWLPLAVAFSGVFGFSYLATQQNYRQSVNDPQIQMAEDAAASLARDNVPANVVPHGAMPIDIATSLATWVAVYDSTGTPIESNAVLDDALPRLPAGLFNTDNWREQKTWQTPVGFETRVSWQPNPDVRQAVVIVRFEPPYGPAEFVAVGRSMRAVEERITALTYDAAIAWGATSLASFAVIFILLALGWL